MPDTAPHPIVDGSTAPGAAIEARGLLKRYGAKVALRDFDLTVPAGTVTALLGPNGAGKTTAVRILTTLSEPMRVMPPSPATTWSPRGTRCAAASA